MTRWKRVAPGAPDRAFRLLAAAWLAVAAVSTPAGRAAVADPGDRSDRAGGIVSTGPDGWAPLEMRGMRELEVFIEVPCRIDARIVREAEGRFRAGWSFPSSGEETEVAWLPADMDVSRESSTVYLGLPSSEEETGGMPIGANHLEVVVEVPLRARLIVFAPRGDVSVRGEELAIAMQLEPYEQMASGLAARRRAAANRRAEADRGAAAQAPPKVRGGVGGAVSIRTGDGTVSVSDLTAHLSIHSEGGLVSLERLAGATEVTGAEEVRAGGLQGDLEIGNASSVRAEALGGKLRIRESRGPTTIKGVVGQLRLGLSDSVVDLEDLRGPVQGEILDGTVDMRDIRGSVRVDTRSVDVTAERVHSGINVQAEGGTVLLRNSKGAVAVGGGPELVEIEKVDGSVNIHARQATVRIRDVDDNVGVRMTDGDLFIENVSGHLDVSNAGGSVTLVGEPRKVNIDADWIDAEYTSVKRLYAQQYFRADSYARLSLPEGDYELRLRAGGSIDSDIPYVELEDPDERREEEPADPSATKEDTGQRGPGREALARTTKRKPTRRGGKVKITVTCSGDVDIQRQ